MSAWIPVLVGLGAAGGAPLRYLADTVAKSRFPSAFPWGPFAVNVVGSLVLGALTAATTALPPEVTALAGTGLCGALTTYSTFGYEVVGLTERREVRTAATYLLASVVTGLAAAAVGGTAVRAAP